MHSLSKRIDRIEELLEPDTGPVLRWPNGDGTLIEVPGCRSLIDLVALVGVERRTDDDRRQA